MNETDRLSPAVPLSRIEIKRSGSQTEGIFTGYGSTFGGPPDSYGDIIDPGAFADAIREHEHAETMPAMLWSHDQTEPVGRWLELQEDDYGLRVSGRLTLGTHRGREALALLKDDAIGLSIGFMLKPTGYEHRGGVRHIKRIEKLAEISLVAMPANTRARVTGTKAKPTTPRDLEKLLRDAAGLSAREAKRAASGGWSAYAREGRPTSDLDSVVAQIEELKALILER